jgi:hypothetical protein
MGRLITIAGVIFTLLAASVHAAPLNDSARKELRVRLLASATAAREDRPEDALRKCNEAQSYAARYDQDALVQGRIEICFGRAALFRNDRNAACVAYARALRFLTSADPSDAMLDLDRTRRSHRELGC